MTMDMKYAVLFLNVALQKTFNWYFVKFAYEKLIVQSQQCKSGLARLHFV